MRRVLLRLTVPAMLISGLLFSAVPAAAATIPAGGATYRVPYLCLNCPGTPTYPHLYTVTVDCTGALSGTGVSETDPFVIEDIKGRFFEDPITKILRFDYTAVYTARSSNPGYTIVANGTVNPVTGALDGTASAAGGAQLFTVTGTRVAFAPLTCSVPGVDPNHQHGPNDNLQHLPLK